ncbi:hypothetical protein QFZ75_007261 [Streptomyces sp. V3I8]|nr:hypothetical protein [Streptomyces sp. V3I8]
MPRRRVHVAMVGIPIVSHVLPSLALIRELVTHGHRVTYANDPFVADQIESAGAELVPCTSTLPVADNDWPADPVAAASLFLDDAVQALPQLRAAYDDDPADWHRHMTLAMAAHACLTVLRARQLDADKAETDPPRSSTSASPKPDARSPASPSAGRHRSSTSCTGQHGADDASIRPA